MPPKKSPAAKKPAVKKTAATKAKKATPVKKASKPTKKATPAKKTAAAPTPAAAATGATTTILIEACKQCQCFKKRAEIVEKSMKALKPGLKFIVNAERPTKGSFVVKTDKGTTLFSLTGLVRPFPALKAVDFEKEAVAMVAKL